MRITCIAGTHSIALVAIAATAIALRRMHRALRKRPQAPSSRSSSSTSRAAPSQAAADKCSEESNGEYTITFEYLPADADGQREQLVRRLGAEDPSIDIIGMDVIWTAEFANAGWIKPWEGELESQVTENVFDSVVEGASFEDTLYTAPFTSNTQLLWYRKDRVEQVPETWDQMLDEAERIGEDGLIQVQADQYEGFVVWVNSMIESAGTQVLEDPRRSASTRRRPRRRSRRWPASRAPTPRLPTSTPPPRTPRDSRSRPAARPSCSITRSSIPSAKENAPDVFEQLEATTYPAVVEGEPSAPPLGGINLGVSEFSENSELAFEAAACMVEPENQLEAAKLGGLPPTREDLYEDTGDRGGLSRASRTSSRSRSTPRRPGL